MTTVVIIVVTMEALKMMIKAQMGMKVWLSFLFVLCTLMMFVGLLFSFLFFFFWSDIFNYLFEFNHAPFSPLKEKVISWA